MTGPGDGQPHIRVHKERGPVSEHSGRGEELAPKTTAPGNEAGPANLMDLPGVHIEAKRVERLNILEAMTKVTRNTGRF